MKSGIYKLTLTDKDGILIDSWNVCGDPQAESGDEYNLSTYATRNHQITEIWEAVQREDKQRKGRVG